MEKDNHRERAARCRQIEVEHLAIGVPEGIPVRNIDVVPPVFGAIRERVRGLRYPNLAHYGLGGICQEDERGKHGKKYARWFSRNCLLPVVIRFGCLCEDFSKMHPP